MRRYIPQLDGLRAVAVLLVIGTHTGYIPGGYVGVDVFFALSGYLITTILLREHAEGRWSLKRFYIRRARRLYPALILLLVVLIPFGGTMVPGHYPEAAALTAGYLTDFAGKLDLGGLSHTWSLGVEEQFYLLWPLFLLFSLRRVNRRTIIATTLVLAALMLAAIDRGAVQIGAARGGDILLGCVLALALEGRSLPRPGLIAAGSAVGLIIAVVLGDDPLHGGPAAALAAISATGLIAGVVPGGLMAQALSVRPLIWLGQRSYGVYLWHLPIAYGVSHGNLVSSQNSLRLLIPTLFGSIACAAVSYRYVETRFRHPRPNPLEKLAVDVVS